MLQDFTQIFSEITVPARVVYTDHFKLATSNRGEHESVRSHITAEAKADETRNGFSGSLSIIYTDPAKGIVRGDIPKKFEDELSERIGINITAKVTTCNFGTKTLKSYEAI